MQRKPGLTTGALVAVCITAPLMAVLYLADQLAGLAFVPYDFFDWIGRVLPGDIVIRAIHTIVDVITALNLGETSSTAKTIETLIALVQFFVGGVVAGTILFAVLRWLDRARRTDVLYVVGLIGGAILGLPMILISLHVNTTADAPDQVRVLWLTAAFLVWGGAITWAYLRLTRMPAAAEETVAEPSALEAISLNRRQFLVRMGTATATLTVLGAGVAYALQWQDSREYQQRIERNRAAAMPDDLPNADATLEPAPGTRPEYTPLEDHYRIDINVRPPEIDGDSWRLKIGGMVDNPMEIGIDDLRSTYSARDQYVTLACISNPVAGDLTSTTLWTGPSLRDVLADAGLQDGATHLRISAEDGFYETVALDVVNNDERVMLAYDWDHIPLLTQHGFPLRVYIPDHYGMKQPKWITEIEVMDHDEDGYWVTRGWDKEARMRATSVIDVVAADMSYEQDGQTFVPVGGIAHAGARGISKVEVSVDDGEWVEARLRQPLSETTWVIWRYDWPFQAGEHTFAVRCYEGDGTPQVEERHSTMPAGATGIHTVTRDV
jgi:DMSO/TMAO reductase YedYZ molybdopterin-dependent catalytic subunit